MPSLGSIATQFSDYQLKQLLGLHDNQRALIIKTPCGRAKYNDLVTRKGFLSKIRLIWFILIAAIRDLNKRDSLQ